ncbi:MAG: glycosyl hydrolase family 18 protein [Thiolinea sp.]
MDCMGGFGLAARGDSGADDAASRGSDKQPLPLVLHEHNRPYQEYQPEGGCSYFAEWGVWEQDYHVADIPAQNPDSYFVCLSAHRGPNETLFHQSPLGWLTLQAECRGKKAHEVTLYDHYAAVERAYPGDAPVDPLKGNIGQLVRLKLARPELKVLVSIGGWLMSDPFFTLANDPQARKVFVASVLRFLQRYPVFDGVDIDWEYPGGGALPYLGSDKDYQGYAQLMADLRQALNRLGQRRGRRYQLTAAVSASPERIPAANHARAARYLDYVFAMTYDFYGAWNSTLGHHAALHASATQRLPAYDAASAVRGLLQAGIPADKLVLGVALYGRGWSRVRQVAPGESPFLHGRGTRPLHGTWEPGILDYRAIREHYMRNSRQGKNGYRFTYDPQAEAPYLWNAASGKLISFENPRSARAKGRFVRQQHLAGVFSWEIDADNGDLLNAMHEGLGHPRIRAGAAGAP